MSQQGLRQASVRAVTSSAETYEGDWHRLFDAAGIADGSYNDRLLRWINLKLSAAYEGLPEAMQALAASVGAANFDSIGTFDASTSGGPTGPDAFAFTDQTSCRVSTQYTSNTVTLAGTGGPWTISVTDGEYQLNGGAWTSVSGSAAIGDTVAVRRTSSASLSTAAAASVSVGTTSDTFTLTTVVNQEASDFLGRAVTAGSTEPNATRRGLYDAFYTSLKTGATSGTNILAKLDIIYLLAAGDATIAGRNLQGSGASSSYNVTVSGTPTFTEDRGYTGDGASAYLDTGLTDNVGSPNWTADSAMAGVYINSDPVNSSPILGLPGFTTTTLTPRATGTGLATARTHSGVNVTAATTNRLGFYCIQRPDNANHEVWKNGSRLATAAQATSSLAAANITIFRSNTSYALDRVGAFVLGGHLTADEHTDTYNALVTFLTAVGAN